MNGNTVKNIKQDKISVFLIDDHPIVRDGVSTFLDSQAISVLGTAADAPEALRKLKSLKPDVIVLDVNLPSLDGWDLALRLRRLIPKAGIIAFSIHSSEEYVVRMARSGARGYVMKSQPTSELLEGIRRVFRGEMYFPAGMADSLLAAGVKKLPAKKKLSRSRLALTLPGLCRFKRPEQSPKSLPQ